MFEKDKISNSITIGKGKIYISNVCKKPKFRIPVFGKGKS